jgi:hypothetical protein
MLLPLIFLVLAVVAAILATLLGYIGGTSIDLVSIIGAVLLIVGALAIAVAGLIFERPESAQSGGPAADS